MYKPFLVLGGHRRAMPLLSILVARYPLYSPSATRPQRVPAPSTVGTKTYCAAFQICAPLPLSLVGTTRGASRLFSPSDMDVPRAVPTGNHQHLQRGVMVPIGLCADRCNVIFRKILPCNITLLLYYFFTFLLFTPKKITLLLYYNKL